MLIMNPKFNLRILPVLFFLIGLLLYAPLAQAGLVPCNGLNCTVNDLLKLLVNIYNYLLGLAGLVALFFIIVSGIKRMYFGFVEDSASHLEEAKKGFMHALTGLILIAIAYLVVNSIILILTGGVDSLPTFFNEYLGIKGIF